MVAAQVEGIVWEQGPLAFRNGSGKEASGSVLERKQDSVSSETTVKVWRMDRQKCVDTSGVGRYEWCG